jgi:hypothetical protein
LKKNRFTKIKDVIADNPITTEYRRDEELEKANKKQGRNLPFWTNFIAWTR